MGQTRRDPSVPSLYRCTPSNHPKGDQVRHQSVCLGLAGTFHTRQPREGRKADPWTSRRRICGSVRICLAEFCAGPRRCRPGRIVLPLARHFNRGGRCRTCADGREKDAH